MQLFPRNDARVTEANTLIPHTMTYIDTKGVEGLELEVEVAGSGTFKLGLMLKSALTSTLGPEVGFFYEGALEFIVVTGGGEAGF